MRHSNKKNTKSSHVGATPKDSRRKHISFSRDGNKVRFVKPPPRSMNHQYWFTETESVVKKGINFEVEPYINVSLEVGCRMQLTSVVAPPSSSPDPAREPRPNHKKREREEEESGRVFLEIREGEGPSRWLTVASAAAGEVSTLRVVLPAGVYALRVTGAPRSLLVFAQAWDLETKLD
ncbi:uncharacterized protein TM35_000112500 [Trypanosoma theileri]|uniref:Uncharacterized protein n=1 Tax=Trypanosoma theileri TaxID=67003 RepID=A0A1X0NYD0_9TRYP|nr:uncharacterized protein TM35_000112500 [Trypanosoma theileri]ORC89716.1 hypothetical protein TM35_000112500 [Trypanosoma theileri]